MDAPLSYIDQYGMMVLKPNQADANNILITVQWLLMGGTGVDFIKAFKSLDNHNGTFRQTPWDPEDPSSHDNTSSLCCWYFILQQKAYNHYLLLFRMVKHYSMLIL